MDLRVKLCLLTENILVRCEKTTANWDFEGFVGGAPDLGYLFNITAYKTLVPRQSGHDGGSHLVTLVCYNDFKQSFERINVVCLYPP